MKVALLSLEERAIEWFCALFLIWFGFCVLMPGEMLKAPRFAGVLQYGISEPAVGWITLTCGWLRLVALYINGRQATTPYFRVAFACLGFLVWTPLAAASFEAAANNPAGFSYGLSAVGAGGGHYFLMAVAEIFSVYRAMSDSRYLAVEHRGTNVIE